MLGVRLSLAFIALR